MGTINQLYTLVYKLSTLEEMCVHTYALHLQCSSGSNVKLCTVVDLNLKQALSAPSLTLMVRHEAAHKHTHSDTWLHWTDGGGSLMGKAFVGSLMQITAATALASSACTSHYKGSRAAGAVCQQQQRLRKALGLGHAKQR